MSPISPPFPAMVEEITVAWLNGALAGSGWPEIIAVRAVAIGQDEGFSGCRLYRLGLDHARGSSSLVAKLSPADQGAALRMGGANAREAAFYAAHRCDGSLSVPACHCALFDAGTGASLLLLEDLGHHRAIPFSGGLDRHAAAQALHSLARLHTRSTADDLPCDTLQQAYPFDRLWPQYQDVVARTLPELPLPGTLRGLGDRIAGDPDAALARMIGAGPPTRLHGDAQADNLRFGDGTAWLLDWQLTRAGAGIEDAGYLLISSLPPPLRRRHEGALLRSYRAALGEHGAPDHSGDDGFVRAAAAKLWITVAATLLFDNTLPVRQDWRRIDLARLAAFCDDHDPAQLFR